MAMDWDTDPELKAMREDFIGSFRERRAQLEAALKKSDFKEVVFIAHKLAGAAESYGFAILTEAGSALEDWFEHAQPSGTEAAEAGTVLVELLLAAERDRSDPAGFRSDKRFQKLLAAAASLSGR
jgi:HPt (histidine-containing phosphotransfer) domain-containing protein